MIYIGSVVSRPPVTVARATTIGEAAQEMGRAGVGALLVIDDDQQVGERLVGIVTDRDIVLRGVARGIGPGGRIDALMTIEVITVPAGMGVERAYEIFRDHAIRRLPVLDGRRIVGMVSVDDLLIRGEQEIADLIHPLCDETFAPHREAAPPVVTGRTPVTARTAGTATVGGLAGFAAPARRRTALHAHPGDTLVVHSHIPRAPDRLGEIFEVRTEAGDPPFAVRWSDTGHVSFVYPGPDAEVRCASGRSAADSTH